MLTREGCLARRKRLFQRLDDAAEWVVLCEPTNLVYFANYFQSPFVFRSAGASAVLILGADGSSVLVCDNQLRDFAEESHVDEVVAADWYRGRRSAPHRQSHLIEKSIERLAPLRGQRFAYESSFAPVGLQPAVESGKASLPSVDHVIHEMKRSKDPDEVAVMRRSIHAGDVAFNTALRQVKPGMTELDVYLLVQQTAQRSLGEQALVYGDFVSGPRCQQGGGPPSNRIIEQGDLVLLDFSVVVRGYRGDCANTFICGAAPTSEQRSLYEACLAAMSAGEARLRAGEACQAIDRAVRDSLATQQLDQNFTSHAGHGVGLGHPDPPYIVPESCDVLVAGDIITLEPGQYISGVAGMRYERNYLVTETGFETLSQLKLELEQGA